MKYLLLILVVVAVFAWLSISRRRGGGGGPGAGRSSGEAPRGGAPARMLACAHCGVHLPQPDALFDAGGKPYCSEAHRLAGPR